MGIGGVATGVELEDVVHHRQAEASHHLAVEEQMAVVEAVAQPVDVLQQDFRLTVVNLDDGVLVEADAAPDAVVVRRQQSLQVLVVGGEPLHLHPRRRREVLSPVGIRHHHQVVLHDVVAPLVEHEAPFTRRAQQVHTGVSQLRRIHRQKIRRVYKVNLHSSITSQWPPLSGPTRQSNPFSWSILIFFSTPLRDNPTSEVSSLTVIFGFSFIALIIFSTLSGHSMFFWPLSVPLA